LKEPPSAALDFAVVFQRAAVILSLYLDLFGRIIADSWSSCDGEGEAEAEAEAEAEVEAGDNDEEPLQPPKTRPSQITKLAVVSKISLQKHPFCSGTEKLNKSEMTGHCGNPDTFHFYCLT
jgi:hypothetical protein